MNLVTVVFIFILVWWVVIFTVLPWGDRTIDNPESGEMPGASKNPRVLKKMAITTGISFLITLLLYIIVNATGFSLHDWVKRWADSQFQ